jgi:hypothetical protein
MKKSLPYPPGTTVMITKLSACNNPVVGPGSWENWVPGGAENRGSLPVDYELQGVLMAPVRVGGQIHVFRTWRNGVEADGFFESTPIVKIRKPSLVETFNSVYRVSVPKREEEEE